MNDLDRYAVSLENMEVLRAQVEEQAREIAALKAKPSGVVLPERFEMEPYQTVNKGSTNYKAGFNAAVKQMRESIRSSHVILAPSHGELVREGWQLVPVEPSGDMEEAGCQGYMEADGSPWVMHKSSMGHAYKAMLAATPSAGSQEQG